MSRKKLTFEERIKMAREVHGDKYSYPEQEIENSYSQFKIICPKHGEFSVRFTDHIYKKSGCQKCANEIHSKVIKERMAAAAKEQKPEVVRYQPYEGTKGLFW